MKNEKLAVFFPGNQYKISAPLFYYADMILKQKGYRVINISYNADGADDWIEEERLNVIERLKGLELESCSNVVFVSKSVGTIVAGYVSQCFGCGIKNVFLSPLKGTFPFMKSEECIAIAGDKDRLLEAKELKEYCESNNVPLYLFENAGHAIVDRSDVVRSVEIQKEIVKVMQDYFE